MFKLRDVENFLACLGFFFLSLSCHDIDASNLTISSITWKNFCCSQEELDSYSSKMKSKEGDLFDKEIMNSDIKALHPVFERLIPEFFVKDEKVDIVFQGKIKPFIKTIQWKISGSLEQFSKEEFQKLFLVKEGDRFDKNKILWESRKVVKWLKSRGYSDAQIELQEERPSEEVIDLLVRVKLGTFYYVRSIKCVGLKEPFFSVFDKIKLSQRYDPFSAFLFRTGLYDKRKVDQDRENLLSLMKNAGYADAKITVCPLQDRKSGAITLVFEAKQGEMYSIRKIILPTDDPFALNELMKSYGLFSGGIFSTEAIYHASEAIENLYGSNGYIESVVRVDQILTGEEDNMFDLDVFVDPKEKLRIGRISMRGNTLTNPTFILDQCPFSQMDYFNSSAMKRFENTLMQTGLFEKVKVYASSCHFEENPILRELIIDLKEQPTGNLALSFTYGSESSWKGTVEIRDHHFNLMGLFSLHEKGILALRGQGEMIGLQLSAGQRFVDIQGDFFKPFIFRSSWGYGFDFALQKSVAPSDNIRITRKSFSNKLTREIGENASFLLKHRLGSVKSFVETSSDIEVSDKVKQEIESDFFLQGFGLGVTLDKTIGYGFYLSGWRLNLLGEILLTSTETLHSHVASKFHAKGAFYIPFMKGRLKLSCCVSELILLNGLFDDFPYPERLFTDQETTPRGWKERSIGPKLVNERGIITPYPKGGDRLFAYSSEYNLPVNKEISLFTFADFSYLSLESSVTTPKRVGQLQTSIGYGIRIRSFMGMPLSVGFGYPLVKSDQRNDLSNFFFSLGNSF